MRCLKTAIMVSLVAVLSSCQDEPTTNTKQEKQVMAPAAVNQLVIIETSMGTIKAELWADKAPKTVENFLSYTDKEFFDGLIFHRVISGFMIQGGGMTPQMQQKPVDAPIKNEATAEVANDRGTLAMARTEVVDSATAQFFINLVDNGNLNHKSNKPDEFGYCVFGKVVEGLDVVDAIGKVKTSTGDVPVDPVVIKSIRRVD